MTKNNSLSPHALPTQNLDLVKRNSGLRPWFYERPCRIEGDIHGILLMTSRNMLQVRMCPLYMRSHLNDILDYLFASVSVWSCTMCSVIRCVYLVPILIKYCISNMGKCWYEISEKRSSRIFWDFLFDFTEDYHIYLCSFKW